MSYLQTDELAETRDHLHNVAIAITHSLEPTLKAQAVKRTLDKMVDEISESIAELEEIQQMELHTVYEDDRWEIRVCLLNESCRLCAIDKTKDEDHPNRRLSASGIADALSSAYPEGWRN